jgi:hypothetical protein
MSMRSERFFTVETVIGRGADYKLDSSIELESRPHDITVTNWELVTKVLKKCQCMRNVPSGKFRRGESAPFKHVLRKLIRA